MERSEFLQLSNREGHVIKWGTGLMVFWVAIGGTASANAQSVAPGASEWSAEGLEDVRRFTDSIGTAAFLVESAGHDVVEWGRTTHPFRAHSVRKSFLSALIGIGIASGRIDTTATIAELRLDDRSALSDQEKQATILHLLQSRSGVYHPAASETREAVQLRPERGSHAPGSHWYYNNWDFNALGTIYSESTGETIGAAFEALIAEPLDMQDFSRREHFVYHLEPDRSRYPAYRFRISARDLARFGRLYLHDGAWDDRQLVPRAWVRESTRRRSETGSRGTKAGYGLMWWVADEAAFGMAAYSASGAGGQRLTILPEIQTVVVHMMDTDLSGGPTIGTSTYNALIRLLLSARDR